MKMRRSLVFLMVLSICVTMFAGCGSSSKTEDTKKDVSNSTQPTTDNQANKYKKKLSYTYITFDDFGDGSEPYAKAIAEKFNIEFIPQYVTFDTWTEKIKVSVSSGDPADIMFYQYGPQEYSSIKNWAQSGTLAPLPDLKEVSAKYPNLAKLIEANQTYYDKTYIDGKQYMWFRGTGKNFKDLAYTSILYRKDWAEKLGMRKSEDTYTASEFAKLMRAFVEKDPQGNGTGKTTGYAEESWALGYVANVFEPHGNWSTFDKFNGKYDWTWNQPGKKEQYKFMNELYKSGAYYKDFYNMKDGDAEKLANADLLGAYQQNFTANYLNTCYSSWEAAHKDKGPKFEDAWAFMKVIGSDNKEVTWSNDPYYGAYLYGKGMTAEKMDRLLDVMNWMADGENLKSAYLGNKGEHWNEEGGNITINWPKDASGNTTNPNFKSYTLSFLATAYEGFAEINPAIPQSLRKMVVDMMSRRNADTCTNIVGGYSLDYDYLSGIPSKDKYGTFINQTQEVIPKLIMSKNFDADWDKFVKEWGPKVQEQLDQVNAKLGLK